VAADPEPSEGRVPHLTNTAIKTLAWLVASLTLAACTTVPINLPAVTDQPTNAHLSGKFIWHDLLTDDPKAAQRFYGELFGWTFHEIGPRFGAVASANYTLIRHEGRLIGGMIDESRLDSEVDLSQWVGLMSTGDIDAAVATLKRSGGTVYTPPTELADRGRIAVVADPQGALFALLQTRDGDPADEPPRMNEFLWDEVWVEDVEAAAAFYQELAGLESSTLTRGEEPEYLYLAGDDVPRFGILPIPLEDLPPLWTPYLRVADPGAIVARVEELGGRVVLEPVERAPGVMVALIIDPSGAGVAIQTWSPKQ
jgi:predicted enzyme related to lactoylglutathione lyase